MAFTIEIDTSGIDEALGKLVPELDRHLSQAMQVASLEVTNEAKQRAPKDTSNLVTSIQPIPTQGTFSGGSLEGGVTATAPYAMHVEYGTGLWGPKRARIFPKKKKALADLTKWPPFGPVKSIRGMRPQPYMAPAWEAKRERVIEIFRSATRAAINRAGKG